MKGKDSLLKIGAVYTISNIVVKGVAFLTTPIFARMLSQEEFGQFSNISSWINILITVITFDLFSAVSLAKYDFNKNIKEYMSSALLLGNVVTFIFYLLFEFNMDFAERMIGMNSNYIRIMFLYFMFSPAVQILLAKYRVYNEYKNVLIVTWINTIVAVGAQILLVFLMTDKLWGRFLGNYFVVSILNIIFWIKIVYEGRTFSPRYFKHALKLAVPLIPHVLSGVLLTSSDRIMINSICGSKQAALYSLAYTISTIASVILASLNQAWIPWMFDRYENNKDEITRTMKPYTCLFSLFCYGLMLFGPEAVLIFGGKNYLIAKYVVPPVVFALLLQFVYTQYVNIEFYNKKNIYISIATIVAIVINISLNFILLPAYGYLVAAYTTVIGYLVMVIAHYYIVKRVLKVKELYDNRYFLFAVICGFMVMILSLFSYDIIVLNIILRVVYIVIVCFWLFRMKGKLKLRKS